MKALGNIYLTWRKSKGQSRIIVGVIKRNVTDGVRFQYIQDGIRKAKQKGLLVLLTFRILIRFTQKMY